jgi:hypothetical protein
MAASQPWIRTSVLGCGRLSRLLRGGALAAEQLISFFAAALAAVNKGRWFNHIRCHTDNAACA